VTQQPSSATHIAPGGTATFTVRYSPTAVGANLNATVQINTNSRDNVVFLFTVRGSSFERRPQINIYHGNNEIHQDGRIDAGDVLIILSDTITVSIRNNGDAPLVIDTAGITITGPDVQAFNRSTTPTGTVPAGGQTSFNIVATPIRQGENNAILTIPSNDNFRNPAVVNLRITGTAPSVVALAQNTWTDGNIPAANGEQWFIFTATAATQFIHAELGTLLNLHVQLFDFSGNTVGLEANLSGSSGNTTNITRTLTTGQEYYIRVRPASGSGAYRIAFNTIFAPPGTIGLTVNTWADGSVLPARVRWFSFTATAATQFVHVELGNLANVQMQVFDGNGSLLGNEVTLSGNNRHFVRTLTVGQEYFIRVTRPNSGTGTYRIGFNALVVPPSITPIGLTVNTWANGSIATHGTSQWFSFAATAVTQHIHTVGALGMRYQVFDNSGNTVGADWTGATNLVTRTLTVGQEYYVQAMLSSDSNVSYNIAFNSTHIPPGAIELTENAVTQGTIPFDSTWFKFTATAETQWFHFAWGTANTIVFQLFDTNGNVVGVETNFRHGMYFGSRTLIVGQDYYLRVRGGSGSTTGQTFGLVFNRSVLAPGINPTTLTENTWWNIGTIPPTRGPWFSFTATAATQHIHLVVGSMVQGGVMVFDSNNNPVSLSGPTTSGGIASWSSQLTVGELYHVYILSGHTVNINSLRLAFNSSATPPSL
jgi:hypothetical protein